MTKSLNSVHYVQYLDTEHKFLACSFSYLFLLLRFNFGMYMCDASFTHADEQDNKLSTAALIALSMVGTFIFTLIVTTLTNVIIISLYYKYQDEKELKSDVESPISHNEIKMDTNPSYTVIDSNTIRVSTTQVDTKNIRMDNNPAYTHIDSRVSTTQTDTTNIRMHSNPAYTHIDTNTIRESTKTDTANIRMDTNPAYCAARMDTSDSAYITTQFDGDITEMDNAADTTSNTATIDVTNPAYSSTRINTTNPDYISIQIERNAITMDNDSP